MSETSQVLWWPKERSLPGTCRPNVLQPGDIVSRYSQLDPIYDEGYWLEPPEMPRESRLINFFNDHLKLRRFRLLKPLRVEVSNATPWFDMKGRGRQYRILDSYENELGQKRPLHIRDLIILKYMVEIDEEGNAIEPHRILDLNDFCNHWHIPPEISRVESYNELKEMADGVYVDLEYSAIFVKNQTEVQPVTSYRRDAYILQQLLHLYSKTQPVHQNLSEFEQSLIRYVLSPVDSHSKFINSLSAISDISGVKIDLSDWEFNILRWHSGDRESIDQIYTIDTVSEEEFAILFWERGIPSEVIRIFGVSHLYEYLLNFYCHWI